MMKKFHGIIYATFASLAFGLMPILVKVAYSEGLNAITVVFLRYFLTAIILLLQFVVRKVKFRLNNQQLIKTAFLGLIGLGTCLSLFSSYKYISLGLATAIHFIYPSIVAFLSLLFYKERLSIRKVIALAISIVGIFILVAYKETNVNLAGVLLSFTSGIMYAINVLGIGKGAIKNVSSPVLTFYLCLFPSIGILGYGLASKSLKFTISFNSAIAIIGVSFISTLCAMLAFYCAVKIIGPANTAILNTLEPVTSIILGVILFKEKMSIHMVLGSIMIIGSSIIFYLSPGELGEETKKTYKEKVIQQH